jgi:Holliday junction resolvase RusA-like endonuclease
MSQGGYRLEFEVQLLPKLPNQLLRQAWYTVKREKDKWHALVGLKIAGKTPESPLSAASLEFHRYSSREPDFDGLVGSFKIVTDALKKSGVIIDDRPSVIGQPKYFWHYTRPRDGRISVKVEAI